MARLTGVHVPNNAGTASLAQHLLLCLPLLQEGQQACCPLRTAHLALLDRLLHGEGQRSALQCTQPLLGTGLHP